MSTTPPFRPGRRALLAGLAATGAGLALPARAQTAFDSEVQEDNAYTNMRRNISSFHARDWQPYFSNLTNGAILVDISSRALHYWSEDQSIYRLFPTSVPISEELTRRGRTEVIRKVEGPTWAPTPSMKQRNPEWPDFVPAGPDNPLGTHALYLSWRYYRIHGTHDTRKIGRKSSNGCIGLYNQHIQELFGYAKIGTQVLLI
ncbi:L,D-transpeptidase [Phaeovulum vinaykumarii]|uniref:L,D-transpeptidase catalytic domain n=1 Tax=Phaeovulum vinaykumarii TaxID=407234 RepID=A0A1N7KZS4_9RHOB|nr:L,D-transpeptidase [Phaeovulum vinaykumarii]SIS67083.1 L,D-transpeptidase catalytic domain [Phaeovulum vinaykumarii]SOC00854.1 L,D-transpeptidase-like protein [Phaeovulum vinaykumarii]